MKAKNLSRKLTTCAAMVAMLTLTGCSTAPRSEGAYGHQRQGHYLYLKKAEPYTPPRDEKWVSPELLETKDQTILELNRQLERQGVQPLLPR